MVLTMEKVLQFGPKLEESLVTAPISMLECNRVDIRVPIKMIHKENIRLNALNDIFVCMGPPLELVRGGGHPKRNSHCLFLAVPLS